MDEKERPEPRHFLSDSLESDWIQPLYSNFVGVHVAEDEMMLTFCIRQVNPKDAGGRVIGIRPHTNIFLSPTAAHRLFLALKSHYGD